MELQIVQLKVCHRRYFTKSSRTWVCAYLITSKILQELSFGTWLCNVLCQGFSAIAGLPSAHVLCLVAFLLGGYLGTFCLPNKLFWWLQLVLSCCLYCLDLCDTGKFAEMLWAAKGTSITGGVFFCVCVGFFCLNLMLPVPGGSQQLAVMDLRKLCTLGE